MTGDHPTARAALLETLRRLWDPLARPDPAAFLAAAGPLPPRQLGDLLRADQEARWRGGARVPAEAYLAAFPELGGSPEDALVVVYGESLLRRESGEPVDPGEYRRRFPALADDLDWLFELDDLPDPLTRPTPPIGRASGPHATTLPADRAGAGPGAAPLPASADRYVLGGKLAEGGMGVVYRAT